MIILECMYSFFWEIARFFFWITTARDCKHCVRCTGYKTIGLATCEYHCVLSISEKKECIKTLTRKHFVRDKRR